MSNRKKPAPCFQPQKIYHTLKGDVYDHFSQIGKMVPIGSGAKRELLDYELSRYACYLIVQNGDPEKSIRQIEREQKKLK